MTDNTMTKRYQRGNQMEWQTIQRPKDTKEVNRKHKRNDRQYKKYLQSFLTSVSHNYCVHQWVHVTKSLVFCGVFCRSLFVLLVCRSIYDFWLPLWYLLVIVLSVIPFMISDYLFGIFWSLYCLSFHLWFLTIQWPKDTKEVIRWNDRQYNDQKIPKR
jgi:hypothetical protein